MVTDSRPPSPGPTRAIADEFGRSGTQVNKRNIQLSDIDLNLLVALHALLETGSVTRAAAWTGVTQSGMSHTLRRLREYFGDKLLVRSGSGMVLTPRAEAMREPLFEGLSRLQSTLRSAQDFVPEASTRRFTIGASDLMQLLVAPRFARMVTDEAPSVTVRLDDSVFSETFGDRLEDGELDVVVGSVLLQAQPHLKRTLLRTEPMICATRRDHPAVSDTLTLDDYLELPHLLISPSGSGPAIVDTLLAQQGKSRRVAMQISSFLIAPWVLPSSDYVLTAPAHLIHSHSQVLDLALWNPPIGVAEIPIYMFWHERAHDDPALRWVRDVIIRACRNDAPMPHIAAMHTMVLDKPHEPLALHEVADPSPGPDRRCSGSAPATCAAPTCM